jgi:hypothetical protein
VTSPFPLEFDALEYHGRGAAEKRLLVAVLLDAVACYMGQVGRRAERGGLRVSAERWIFGRGEAHCFLTFENVCELLGIPATKLRRGLLGHLVLTAAFDMRAQPRKSAILLDVGGVHAMFADGYPVNVIARRYGVAQKMIRDILGPQTPGALPAGQRKRTSARLAIEAA